MDRKRTVEIIAAKEYQNISSEYRKELIFNAWGLDETDEIFPRLSSSLRDELLNFEQPQSDLMSSRYDTLVRLLCEDSYSSYSNEDLAVEVSEILRKTVMVYGDEPERYGCPCCGEKTLFIRGEYDICSNCGWEDDGSEEENHYSGPNHMTLRQGRENYLRCGRCERKEFNKLSAKDFCI